MIEEPRGAFMYRSSIILGLYDFGVPKRFPWLSILKTCLRVGRQDSQFGPILARLLENYSVSGSRSDFTIDGPRGAFTGPSSTLTFFAAFGPFHELLLIVLRSSNDFHN